MAFRSEKAACFAGVTLLALAPALFGQQELRYNVEHRHRTWRDGAGTLVIAERGISYQETSRKKNKKPEQLHHGWWDYENIQQLWLAPRKLTIVTYKDRPWLLGMDQQWEFRLPAGESFNAAYELLKNRLDQRLVAALAEQEFKPLWEIPVKLLGRIRGSEGVLEVGADRIVYRTGAREQSRTWRLRDIENVSSSGPFHLTLTSYERAKFHYGSLKGFNFQLKRPLNEGQYNELWRRVQQAQGLQFLRVYRGKEDAPLGASIDNQEKTQP
jgi:hypothetical protein